MHFFALFMYMLVLVMHLNTFGTVMDTLQHKSCRVPHESQFWDSRVSILRLGWNGKNCTIMCLYEPDKSIIYAFLPFLCICWCLLCMWTLLVLLWTLYNTNLAESHPSLNSETRVVRRKPPKNIASQKITFRVIRKHRQMPWSLQNTAKLFFRGGSAWLFEIKFGE